MVVHFPICFGTNHISPNLAVYHFMETSPVFLFLTGFVCSSTRYRQGIHERGKDKTSKQPLWKKQDYTEIHEIIKIKRYPIYKTPRLPGPFVQPWRSHLVVIIERLKRNIFCWSIIMFWELIANSNINGSYSQRKYCDGHIVCWKIFIARGSWKMSSNGSVSFLGARLLDFQDCSVNEQTSWLVWEKMTEATAKASEGRLEKGWWGNEWLIINLSTNINLSSKRVFIVPGSWLMPRNQESALGGAVEGEFWGVGDGGPGPPGLPLWHHGGPWNWSTLGFYRILADSGTPRWKPSRHNGLEQGFFLSSACFLLCSWSLDVQNLDLNLDVRCSQTRIWCGEGCKNNIFADLRLLASSLPEISWFALQSEFEIDGFTAGYFHWSPASGGRKPGPIGRPYTIPKLDRTHAFSKPRNDDWWEAAALSAALKQETPKNTNLAGGAVPGAQLSRFVSFKWWATSKHILARARNFA